MLYINVDKLGFSGVFALAFYDCFVHLFKGGAPRTVALAAQAIRHFFGNFFAFGFAKQMADVSQTRKICASGFKEKVGKK